MQQQEFDELREKYPNISVTSWIREPDEDIAEFAARIRNLKNNLNIVQVYGAHTEIPIAFNDFGENNIYLVHRADEVLERAVNNSGEYSVARIKALFENAKAIVLLGKANYSKYKEWFGDKVCYIPHGFTEIDSKTIN